MNARSVLMVALSIALLLPLHARAQPTQSEASEREAEWYGWQTLIADGIGVGIMASGLALESNELLVAGVVLDVFGPPVLHASRGNGSGFLASLGVRLLGLITATALALTAGRTGCPAGERCFPQSSDVAILLATWATVAALDALLFARVR